MIYTLPGVRITYVEHGSLDQYRPELNLFLQEQILGLDTEGIDLHGSRLRLIQIADSSTAWNFDVSDPSQVAFLAPLFASPARRWISHTGIDPRWLASYLGWNIAATSLDTWTLACLLEPSEVASHALKPLCTHHLDPVLEDWSQRLEAEFKRLHGPRPRKPTKPTPPKSTKPDAQARHLQKLNQYQIDIPVWEAAVAVWESFNGWEAIPIDNEVYQTYAGLDAIYARRLFYILIDELVEMGIPQTTITEEMWWYQINCALTIRGMRVDTDYARDVTLGNWEDQYEDSRRAFEELTGFVSGSPRLRDYLLERGVPLEDRTEPSKTYPQGQESLAKRSLEKALTRYLTLPDPDPDAIRAMELREAVAEATNYVTITRNVLARVDAQSLVHPTWKGLAAVTGRTSATEPPVQTLKGAIVRGMFVPYRPDEVLVSFDMSQIEPRIMCAFANETGLIQKIKEGLDVYDASAQMIYGSDFTKKQRSGIKRSILATAYGGGIGVIQNQLRLLDGIIMSEAEVTSIRQQWRRLTPRIYARSQSLAIPKDVWLESGRRVPHDPARLYKNGNSEIQGTARDVLRDGIFRSVQAGYGDRLVAHIHDEAIYSLPRVDLDGHIARLVESWQEPFHGVPVAVEVEIYEERWGHGTRIWTPPETDGEVE
jgi:DNA polymerase I